MTVLAVDWSGRRFGERRHLWTAEAHDGALVRLEAGRSRGELVDELVARVEERPGIVVGFDFSFSLPEWFLTARGFTCARELWDAAATDGDRWLCDCDPPFWGRPGRRRPDLPAHLRRTEAEMVAVGGIRPKSSFQIGGAGSVGTGSVRGFPVLATLQDAGYAIWPFDAPAAAPVAVEIWPRAFTGPVVKSSPTARAEHLGVHLPQITAAFREAAVGSEDAFDAAVSAVVMSLHETELRALRPAAHPVDRREGCVWTPRRGDQEADSADCSRATEATMAGCSAAEMSLSAVYE